MKNLIREIIINTVELTIYIIVPSVLIVLYAYAKNPYQI